MKLLVTILMLIACNGLFANTIVVGKDQVITSLRNAVELARNNDTILLRKGVYREGNIIIRKTIRLIGIDQPILDGEHKYEILTVSANGVIIKGIHFKNSGYSSMNDFASVNLVDAGYAVIENNVIEEAYFAIHLGNSRNCVISNNIIKSTPKTEQTSGNGIHLWKCDSMVVKENDIQGHRDGIYFEFVTNSFISGNISHDNLRYGLHFMFSNQDTYIENTFMKNGAGVAVMYSHNVAMLANTFGSNWGPNAYGLLLKEISDARIHNNVFTYNTVGVLMESTNRIDVRLNSFKNNGWAFRIQASCNENVIHYNNFQGNTFDVATNGTMMLNEFLNNYWDKYEGYDMNRDGKGDIAYHPVSMYSMVIESNPPALILLRSFMVLLLDRAERAIPSLTPENLVDKQPLMKALRL